MSLEPMETMEPRKTGHRWIDLIVALTALFVSVMSIFVAQHTSETMEKLVHANSWPFLQLGSGNATTDMDHELSFGVENVGTGPARIHTFAFQVDGQTADDTNYLYGLINACCAQELADTTARANGDPRAAVGFDLTSSASSRFLAPGQEITAIRWARTETNQALWTAVDQARQTGRITMSACYCSVFDECWIARTDQFPPAPVDRCDATPNASTAAAH